MRSRVNKNQSLYSQIASDTESKVESHDLSHFANRLNAIDEQFGKMEVGKETSQPNHARNLQERYQEELKSEPLKETLEQQTAVTFDDKDLQTSFDSPKETQEYRRHDEFDTFESTYLNDFLQEVKEYNVKKGYRDIENTSTNIMKDLNLDIEINKSRFISDADDQSPFIPEGIDDLLTQIDPLIQDMETPDFKEDVFKHEEVVFDDALDATKVFTAVDHMQRFDQDDAHLEETIAMEVLRMVGMDEVQESLDLDSDKTLEMDSIHDAIDTDETLDEPLFESYQEESLSLDSLDSEQDLNKLDSLIDDVQFDEDVSFETEAVEDVSIGKTDEFLTPFGYQTKVEPEIIQNDLPDYLEGNSVLQDNLGFDKVSEDSILEVSQVETLDSQSQLLNDPDLLSGPGALEPAFEEFTPEPTVQDEEITRRLMEQTQTLQIKVIDQEKNIEEISDTMVRTNRLLNVTLSLLMLAIFVVIMLIVSNIWR